MHLKCIAYPYSLRSKVSVYLGMLRDDPQYRKGIAAMTVNEMGDGIAAGAAFSFASYVGGFDTELSIGLVVVIRIVETLSMMSSYLLAAHKRDNAEYVSRNVIQKNDYKESNDTYLKQLSKSAVNDLVITCVVIASLAMTMYQNLLSAAIGLFVLTRIPRVMNKGYESGAFNSLKYTLGNGHSHQKQLDITHSIGAIEGGFMTISFMTAFSTAYTVCASFDNQSVYHLISLFGAFGISALFQYVPKHLFIEDVRNSMEEK